MLIIANLCYNKATMNKEEEIIDLLSSFSSGKTHANYLKIKGFANKTPGCNGSTWSGIQRNRPAECAIIQKMSRFFETDPHLKFFAGSYERTTNITNFVPKKVDKLAHVGKADRYSVGIGGYLKDCWSHHAGVVVSPDMMWQIAFSQIVGEIVKHVEEYRAVFTRENEKQLIAVMGPLTSSEFFYALMEGIRLRSPFDVGKVTPRFSTTTDLAFTTNCALTLECASQYYDYGMFMCGFPSVTVLGTDEDWKTLAETWHRVVEMIDAVPSEHKNKVQPHLDWANKLYTFLSRELLENLDNQEFWGNMYTGEKCGSGSDFYVKGWILNFIYQISESRMMGKNFPHCIATVDYKNLDTGDVYTTYSGVIGSNRTDLENGGVVFSPEYGMAITGDNLAYCGIIDAVLYEAAVNVSSGPKRAYSIIDEKPSIQHMPAYNPTKEVSETKSTAPPVRNDIIVLPAEGPSELRLGWHIHEKLSDISIVMGHPYSAKKKRYVTKEEADFYFKNKCRWGKNAPKPSEQEIAAAQIAAEKAFEKPPAKTTKKKTKKEVG